MPKSTIFPYGITLREGGKASAVPVVEVQFGVSAARRNWISLLLIIDSGATISALPKSDAKTLGIDLEDGESVPILVGGISGRPVRGSRHPALLRIAGNTLLVPFIFLEDDRAPRVLGREGVFDLFTIIFDERRERSGFLSESTREQRLVGDVLDDLESN